MSKRSEVAEVLIAAHLPGCKFEGRIISGSIDTMPVSGLILELKRCLWDTKHVKEYEQFLKMVEFPNQERQQAKVIGLNPNSHNKVKSIKRHIHDTLIDDGVEQMPAWLYHRCDEIYYINLKGVGELW